MADEDIDSLLEQGIKAAQQEQADKESGKENQNGAKESSKSSSRRHRRSRSYSKSRSRSRSRSKSRRRRRRDDRRGSRSRSRSRSRSSRRRSSRRSRSNSRSRRGRSRRDRDRSRSRGRDRDRDRRRSRSKSPSKATPKQPLTAAEKEELAKQRELMELTRDHRTVFVGQLTQKVRERDLEKFFGKIGKIEHVLLIRDKFTNRSKGFAYVEMSNLEDVPKVLLLNGQAPDFQMFPIMIKASEAEKNFAAKKDSVMNSATKASGLGAGLSGASLSAASRIYCGNLHTNITEEDLRCVFQSFGDVVSVTINRDEMGRSKGFGFIQFSSPSEANFALSKGNGLELSGNYLKLGCVNENAGNEGFAPGTSGWKLEDDDGAGLTMNSQSRAALMAKLAGAKDIMASSTLSAYSNNTATNGVPAPAAAQQAERAATLASHGIEGSESFCFVVKNMFDVMMEKKSGNPDWHVEIQEDVQDECSNYGTVLHTFVEKEKDGGLVYVLFDNVQSASVAANKLHGRWFNKRQISVRYLSSQEYVGMFPEARSAVQTARANAS
ncbi:TPA: hypothetical protein N0F65_010636 [Lagenidium giganteum]|uniref:RRM domain-containing protein n=1 Tax=Lagenidium giganteum TaxID=4803 RepID=A0AAV2ZAI6_9STRA|nr:TPA: hypothetical protein N0F65_010636 [Lagenidium giganteum]